MTIRHGTDVSDRHPHTCSHCSEDIYTALYNYAQRKWQGTTMITVMGKHRLELKKIPMFQAGEISMR